MNIECGEIYWLERKDAQGHEYQKKRPYLVVDTAFFIRKNSLICAVALTSHFDGHQPDDIFLKRSEMNGLVTDSLIKTAHLYAFDKSRFQRIIGKVDLSIVEQVHRSLRNRFNL